MDDLKKSFWKNIHFVRVVVWYGVNQTILHNSEVSIFCPFFSSSFSQNHPGAKFLNSVPQPAVTTLPSLLHNSFSMPPTLLRFWLVKMLQVSCNMHTKNNLNVCIKTETVTDTVGADAMVYSYVRLLFTCTVYRTQKLNTRTSILNTTVFSCGCLNRTGSVFFLCI